MFKKCLVIFFISLSLFITRATASHIVGGEVTYKYLRDSFGTGSHIIYHQYEVNVIIYEDCQNGQPQAIKDDNPAWIGVFNGLGQVFQMDTGDNPGGKGVPFSSSIPVPANFNNSCVAKVPTTCLLKKTFTKVYSLPDNASGYIVAYQRCCRNNATINIIDPGNNGATYFCTIPPSPYKNNSAVFKNYPPQIICLNNPLYYDNAATDADGDSLSYEFCSASIGASDADIKPPPSPPNTPAPDYYKSVNYFPPFTSKVPITGYPIVQIDPVSGLISGTPNRVGRYLVTVCCHEWRDGFMINTVKREFQFVVTSCTKVVVADIPQFSTDPNTYIVNCKDFGVHFVNNSTGGFAYHWDFGVPNLSSDTSDAMSPDYIYPDTGTFTVKLIVNPRSTCPDSIFRLVKMYPKFKSAFSDSGVQCPGAPIQFRDLTASTFKPIVAWKWLFGDGDSSLAQDPVHTYLEGGIYNVILISSNIRSCIDTAAEKVAIDIFKPFAGHDTAIVKGESVLFHASGGVKYAWTPANNLSDTSVSDPVGYYPDNGIYTYYVHVESPYGCKGYDTMKVTVVNQANIVVPTAFTPNGDGRNDIFRPMAIGYKDLDYFRVFNRWGQEVFFTTTLEIGWDGYYRNVQAEMGTYYWQISFIDRNNKKTTLKGDVQLIR